jgi:hypothetical protein
VPDAKTIWLLREPLARAGAIGRLLRRFEAVLREADYLAMGGQIVDAPTLQARRPRPTKGEKATGKGGVVPADWSQAERAQMDTDGPWPLKRGRRRPVDQSKPHEATRTELVTRSLATRTTSASTAGAAASAAASSPIAASHDGHQLGRLLDPHNTVSSVWADTAYRSEANLSLLARRGLTTQFQRPKPSPPHIAYRARFFEVSKRVALRRSRPS